MNQDLLDEPKKRKRGIGRHITMWLHSEWLQRLGGGFGEQLAVEILARLHFIMLGAHKEKEVVRLLKRVRKERKCLLTGLEQFLVYSLARPATR